MLCNVHCSQHQRSPCPIIIIQLAHSICTDANPAVLFFLQSTVQKVLSMYKTNNLRNTRSHELGSVVITCCSMPRQWQECEHFAQPWDFAVTRKSIWFSQVKVNFHTKFSLFSNHFCVSQLVPLLFFTAVLTTKKPGGFTCRSHAQNLLPVSAASSTVRHFRGAVSHRCEDGLDRMAKVMRKGKNCGITKWKKRKIYMWTHENQCALYYVFAWFYFILRSLMVQEANSRLHMFHAKCLTW